MLKSETKQEGIDYTTDLTDIDSMLGEMAKPKQEMPSAHQPSEQSTNSEIFDPTQDTENNETSAPLDPEKNDRQGVRIAKMIDGGIGIAAMKLAHADSTQPYQATEGEIEDIGEAWAEYTQDKDINLPPWLSLAFLYVTVYMPRMIKAFNDKRLHEQDVKLENHDSKLSDLTDKYNELLKNQQNDS